jgi:hypothetical protein
MEAAGMFDILQGRKFINKPPFVHTHFVCGKKTSAIFSYFALFGNRNALL